MASANRSRAWVMNPSDRVVIGLFDGASRKDDFVAVDLLDEEGVDFSPPFEPSEILSVDRDRKRTHPLGEGRGFTEVTGNPAVAVAVAVDYDQQIDVGVRVCFVAGARAVEPECEQVASQFLRLVFASIAPCRATIVAYKDGDRADLGPGSPPSSDVIPALRVDGYSEAVAGLLDRAAEELVEGHGGAFRAEGRLRVDRG